MDESTHVQDLTDIDTLKRAMADPVCVNGELVYGESEHRVVTELLSYV